MREPRPDDRKIIPFPGRPAPEPAFPARLSVLILAMLVTGQALQAGFTAPSPPSEPTGEIEVRFGPLEPATDPRTT